MLTSTAESSIKGRVNEPPLTHSCVGSADIQRPRALIPPPRPGPGPTRQPGPGRAGGGGGGSSSGGGGGGVGGGRERRGRGAGAEASESVMPMRLQRLPLAQSKLATRPPLEKQPLRSNGRSVRQAHYVTRSSARAADRCLVMAAMAASARSLSATTVRAADTSVKRGASEERCSSNLVAAAGSSARRSRSEARARSAAAATWWLQLVARHVGREARRERGRPWLLESLLETPIGIPLRERGRPWRGRRPATAGNGECLSAAATSVSFSPTNFVLQSRLHSAAPNPRYVGWGCLQTNLVLPSQAVECPCLATTAKPANQ
jgi:hypothetical protein